MSPLSPRDVVWTEFPYTDMTQTKWRPALVLAQLSDTDYLMCQLTSKPYGTHFIDLGDGDFEWGRLEATRAANPKKIFTLHRELMEEKPCGRLGRTRFEHILEAIRGCLES